MYLKAGPYGIYIEMETPNAQERVNVPDGADLEELTSDKITALINAKVRHLRRSTRDQKSAARTTPRVEPGSKRTVALLIPNSWPYSIMARYSWSLVMLRYLVVPMRAQAAFHSLVQTPSHTQDVISCSKKAAATSGPRSGYHPFDCSYLYHLVVRTRHLRHLQRATHAPYLS